MTILPKSTAQKPIPPKSVLAQRTRQHPIRRGLSALGFSLLLMLQLTEMPFTAAAPKPPGRGGLPQTKEAGATRTGCDVEGSTEAERSMVAMVPDYPTEQAFANAIAMGYTTQSAPELWVNLPYSPDQLENLTFTILDAEGETYHEADLDLPGQIGLLKVQWPQSKPLEIGERYSWSLSATLDCGKPNPDILSASAEIERYKIDATIAEDQQLLDALAETDAPIVQAELYSEFNLWYDAFALLAAERKADPAKPQVQEAWHRLLNRYKLCDWSMQPFINQS